MARKKYEYKGYLYSMRELADMSMASYKVVRERLQSGWSTEDAIHTPSQGKPRKNTTPRMYECVYNGKIMGVTELSRTLGIRKDTIYHRLIRGASLQEVADNPHPNDRKYLFYGIWYSLPEAAELAGISCSSFGNRIRKGESAESIILSGNRNKRTFPYKGRVYTLKELLGLPECAISSIDALRSRLCIYGWSVERAIKTPTQRKNNTYIYQGKSFRLSGLSKLPECVVNIKTLQARLYNRWSVEKALTTPARELNKIG